ncbi:MAG: hypothetical protein ACK46X_18105, partial [Candidatus Sericytochromatia bacterium]
MTRRGAIPLTIALLLAGCGGGPGHEGVSLLLDMVDEAPVVAPPVPVFPEGRPATPAPSVGPSAVPPGSSGNYGGGAPAAPPSAEVGLTLASGDSYTLARIAGDTTGGLAVGTGPLSARFGAIAGMAVAPDGTLYVCDPVNHQVRVVPPTGPAEVLAGDSGGAAGYYGDNVPALATRLSGPTGLARDPLTGAIFVADTGNGRVRLFTPGGRIYTFAGGGGSAADAVNPATAAFLQQPVGLALDHQKRLYVTDRGNGKVRRVEADGRLTTVATLTAGQVGAIAISTDGERLWVAEGGKVRAIRPSDATPVAAAPLFEAAGAVVTGLASDQAGSLFVLVTAASPFGRADTRLWRVSVDSPGRAPVLVAGQTGTGATDAEYIASTTPIPDGADQRLAGGG